MGWPEQLDNLHVIMAVIIGILILVICVLVSECRSSHRGLKKTYESIDGVHKGIDGVYDSLIILANALGAAPASPPPPPPPPPPAP